MAASPQVVIERLLDTNAVSNSLKPRISAVVAPYLRTPGTSAISFQTEGELGVWSASPTIPPAHAEQIRAFVRDAPILYANETVVAHYIAIVRRRRNAGRPENVKDAWIAATALAYGLPLITFDRHGFNDIPDLDLTLLRAA